ncbi:MAG: hypothetical protein RI900_1291, partial [Actinomycetota bacterium]
MDAASTSTPSAAEMIRVFLVGCSARMTALAGPGLAAEGAERFRRAIEHSAALPMQPHWLPVLDSVDSVDNTLLAQQFVDIAPLLPWQ